MSRDGEERPRPAPAPGILPGLLRHARLDLRHAVRLFARQRAILLLTILGLSLGLGIATAAFSILSAARRGEGLLDPARAPGVLRVTDRSLSTTWSYEEFQRLREGATRMPLEAVVTDIAPAGTGPAEASAPSAGVAFVSGGFFAATGGRVSLGRPLVEADDRQADSSPVVVSFDFWSSRLNRNPDVLGRFLRIGRTDAVVVGVAGRGFRLPHNRELWMPLSAYGGVYGDPPAGPPAGLGVEVFGRLPPGTTLSQAEARLSGVAGTLPRVPAAGESALRVRLDPEAGLGRVASSDALEITLLVSAVIALVLLLAGANVATVLISTAITRDREMAVRAALGASRGRIVQQLVTESLALGTIAAALGLLFAHWAIPIIGAMVEAPAGTDLTPDLRVYLFLAIAALLTAVGAGLAPAWHGRGTDLVTPLKGGGTGRNRVPPRRLRFLLVMGQAAVSVILIVLATLFMRAAIRSHLLPVGFDPAGLYAVATGPGDAYGDERAAIRTRSFWARAVPELRTVPGIASLTLSEMTPFGDITRTSITRDPAARVVDLHRTQAGYFETLGLRILGGRSFTPDEVSARSPVALVSQSLARAYWGDRSPLGEILPSEIPLEEATRPVVIGVVADSVTARLHERGTFAVYRPLDPGGEGLAQLLIRVAPDTTGVIEHAGRRLRSIDPQAELRITSVAARLRQEADRPRMLAALTGFVGLVAIALCAIGLYGLTASVIGQRTREMGVRTALGAAPGDLLRLLMGDSLKPIGLGLSLGAGAALLGGRLVSAAIFFGVSPQDPATFGGAAAILLAAAALAVLLPTRRAARVDAARVLSQS